MKEQTQHMQEDTLIYGKNAVAELLKSGKEVDTIWLQDTMQPAQASYYIALAKQTGAVVKRVHAAKLRAMCATDAHQGVAVRAAQITYLSLEELMQTAQQQKQPPFFLLCDGIEDPHNLGALIRSAKLCGVQGVIIPKRSSACVTSIVMKSSAGAAASLPIARVTNLGQAVRTLKKQGVFVYCADMHGAPLEKQDLTGPCALVVGSEGKGVSPLIQKLCDISIQLAMHQDCSGVDSFNVSVAGGIILYEIMRQRAKI